jgi:hypothetical protein
VPPKNDIESLKIFSSEKVLAKSAYLRKKKKGEKGNTSPFSKMPQVVY